MFLSRYFKSISGNTLRCPLVRNLSCNALKYSAYDSDGKTTATVLNQEINSNIMIDSYSKNGFRLNNGTLVVGPVAVFPKTVVAWNITGDDDISASSLTLFTLLEPKLDILVIGYGDKRFDRSKLDRELLGMRKQFKLNIEILPTDRAIATYNFLASESRWVAAALFPPRYIDLSDEDMGIVTKKLNSENFL